MTIAHTVECIKITVNGYPICVTAGCNQLVVIGTVEVSCTVAGAVLDILPYTVNDHTVFVELIGYLCSAEGKGCFGNCGKSCFIEIVPIFVNLEPTAGKYTNLGEIPVTVDLNKAVILALR